MAEDSLPRSPVSESLGEGTFCHEFLVPSDTEITRMWLLKYVPRQLTLYQLIEFKVFG